ncbi:MAG: isocitrate/isopropylmalate family dehydrogenase, partial [Candidatus Methylomirabilales bacterium]
SGQGIANPLAAILAAEMMLDFLGERRAARRIRRAAMAVLAEGKALPADLGGRARTAEVGAAVLHHLRRAARA